MDGGDDNSREQSGSKRRQKPNDAALDADAPKTKRQRVSRACDKCRLCRDKCDGKAPCATCVTNGRDCTYATTPKKRGIQPGYIRTLELSLSLLINRDFELQKYLLTQLSSSHSQLRQSVSLKDASQPDDLLSKWTSSGVCKQIESLLSGSLDDDLPIPDLTPASASLARTPVITSDPPSHLTLSPALQLPTDFWSLLDHYYTYTHNWLPISEKNEILKTAYSYPINESDVQNGPELGRHAELWAIIVLTTQQRTGPKVAVASAVATTRRLIPHAASAFDTGHVRALLLLSLSAFASDDRLAAWVDVGMAARVLTYLITQRSDDLRFRHLVLACHVIEHLIAAHLNLRPHLTKSLLGNMDRINEDGLEEWSPWQPLAGDDGALLQHNSRQPGRSLSTFNALVKICGSLGPDSGGSAKVASPYDNATSRRVSALQNAIKTPQQVHLDIITSWASFKRGTTTRADFEQSLALNMSLFKHCGGQGAIPPTLKPISDSFFTNGVPHSRSGQLMESPVMWKASATDQQPQVPDSRGSYSAYAPMQQQAGAVMIPHDVLQQQMTTPYAGSHPDQRPHTIEAWANNVPTFPPADPSGMINATTPISEGAMNSDFEAIFEEMAQLDGTRQATDPSLFMQNLGIGPDSDLRAFFGADYQESDPLLAYLQFDRPGAAPTTTRFPT